MSAVALIVGEGGVVMAGDGVATDLESGLVSGFATKVRVRPDLNAVLGFTGVGNLEHLISYFLPLNIVDFDDLLDVLPGVFERTMEQVEVQGLAVGGDQRSCIVAAGWSDRDQTWQGWRIQSYPKSSIDTETGEMITLEPWALVPIGKDMIWCSTAPTHENAERFGLLREAGETDADTLTRVIAAVRTAAGPRDGGLIHNIGGFIQLAHVQRDYAQTWIAHRWPEDVIGEPVDPARGEPMPVRLIGAGRDQA